MPAPNLFVARLLSLLAFQSLCWGTAHAQAPAGPAFAAELSKQESIYRDKADGFAEGYVTDRTLADYISALPAEFDRSLVSLGAEDRWLDIGAGMGQAILDYYSPGYDLMHPEAIKPYAKKARAVAMSIEDRRTAFWNQAAARLGADQIRYLYSKPLREYSAAELGRFQIITDVIGGFSYTPDLALFMKQVLALLTTQGSFYSVLQDVRSEDGSNTPYYKGSPFLTEIRDAGGADVGVCAWLKSIGCVQVTCELKASWKPPIEVYRVHKVCDDVVVPALETTHFAAGTPPERRFRLANPPTPPGQTTASR